MGSVPLDRIGRCRGTLSGRTRDRQEAQHHLMGQNQQRETDAYFQQAGQERLHEGCAYWCERREFCVINTKGLRVLPTSTFTLLWVGTASGCFGGICFHFLLLQAT